MSKWKLPVQAVDIRDGDAFKEGDDEQRHVPSEVIKEREDVVARSVREHHGQEAADSTYQGCQLNPEMSRQSFG